MDFEDRLKKAVARGRQRGEQHSREQHKAQLTEEELKRLHTQYRLSLSEHIESCIAKIPQHFPGFQTETVYGDRGWGAACSRDDLRIAGGKRTNLFSRLEMTIRPFSSLHVVELTAKGTVHNREVFNRQYFQELPEIDDEEFIKRIDAWVLEFAELYASAD